MLQWSLDSSHQTIRKFVFLSTPIKYFLKNKLKFNISYYSTEPQIIPFSKKYIKQHMIEKLLIRQFMYLLYLLLLYNTYYTYYLLYVYTY